MSYDEPFGSECGEGWHGIINDTHIKLKYIDPEYKIDQIKEKFGGLRYYFTPSEKYSYGSTASNIMNDIVRIAEYQASLTCELCGTSDYKAGVDLRMDRGFYYNYCKDCSDKLIADRDARFKKMEE